MIIKRSIQFSLKIWKYKGEKVTENLPIRMRVSFNSERLDIPMGYSIDASKWDADAQRVKKNAYSKKKESYSEINSYLNKAYYEMDETFKEFEVSDTMPTMAQVEDTFWARMSNTKGAKIIKKSNFWDAFEKFKSTESVKHSWQRRTIQKFDALATHIKAYKENPRFEDFNDKGLTDWMQVLIYEEDLANVTALKQLSHLKWFLRWAAANRYHRVMDFKEYKPRLSTTQKKVIFLTVPEINQLLSASIPESRRPCLEQVRDVFVFSCFTGLRYSDVYNLKRSDIKTTIDVTTKKTADSLMIEYNDVSRSILDKYKDVVFPDNRALPVISNQKMNDYLKELCEIAGLDEEVRITTYKGGERIDKVVPKYKLISTHAGRRSFICNALAAGIPVNVVMKWTGHSKYEAMKPYIDVADQIRAKEMDKMNNLVTTDILALDRDAVIGNWTITKAKFDQSALMTDWDLETTLFGFKANGFFEAKGFFGNVTGFYSIKGHSVTANVNNLPFLILEVKNINGERADVIVTIQSSQQVIWIELSRVVQNR